MAYKQCNLFQAIQEAKSKINTAVDCVSSEILLSYTCDLAASHTAGE